MTRHGRCLIIRAVSYTHLFDERIRSLVDAEVSIGDYVLTGGEIGAMAISDAVFRLCTGVIREASHEDDSFENGLLEYPQYTRPVDYEGQQVPEVLLSGHHANIRKWRLKESLRKTYLRRPDVYKRQEYDKKYRAYDYLLSCLKLYYFGISKLYQ